MVSVGALPAQGPPGWCECTWPCSTGHCRDTERAPSARVAQREAVPRCWGTASLPSGYHISVLTQTRLKGKTRGTIRNGEYKETNGLWAYFQQPYHLSALCFIHIIPKGSFKEQAGAGQCSFLSLYAELLPSRAAGEKEQKSTNRWWNCCCAQLCCTLGADFTR